MGRPARQRKEDHYQNGNVTDDDTWSPGNDQAVERTCDLKHSVTSLDGRERRSVSQALSGQERARDEDSLARHGSTVCVI